MATLVSTSCDPLTSVTECPVEDPGGTWQYDGSGVSLPSQRTYQQCVFTPGSVASGGADHDGMLDDCEYEIASTFRPSLIFSVDEPHRGREEHWSVRPLWNGPYVEIFFALSYYRDGGFRWMCCGHPGDSEFIVMRILQPAAGGTKWTAEYVTLSAHYNALQDKTSTYYAGDMQYAGGNYRIRPDVYVSWGKHANYRTKGACDSGGVGFDDCTAPTRDPSGVWVIGTANLGNSPANIPGAMPLLDCVGCRFLSPPSPHQECYWYPKPFLGWVDSAGDTGPYSPILHDFGF
ncbi:MAG: hypothetical protein ACYC1S_14980 [Gemmatimonadaceae bacterium]